MNKLFTIPENLNELEHTIEAHLPLVKDLISTSNRLENNEQTSAFLQEIRNLVDNMNDTQFICLTGAFALHNDFLTSFEDTTLLYHIVGRAKELFKSNNELLRKYSLEYNKLEKEY